MSRVADPTVDLSAIDEVITRHGTGADKAIPLLQDIQSHFGYLPQEALRYLASKTQCTPAQIYGVVTFYSQFRLQPVGKHMIRVCHGTACHVQGAERISQTVSDMLHIDDGETTEDGLFTLEKVACLGCCSLSPVIMVDDTVYGKLTRSQVQKILKQYIGQEKAE
jgi:NADH:ubiquinone oxidoreductase subunit E